ncbi:hypothetical protein CBS101457_000254 [Exobasidium rhododendri]|nr:hypothetical protein CBS101457_000254 [Exobasidium rhododendri]
MVPPSSCLILLALYCLHGFSAASPTPMDSRQPYDGSQTSRLNSEEVRRVSRQRHRQQQRQLSHLHGQGGDYATSVEHNNVTYYPNLFNPHPEGIGSQGYRSDSAHGGSSSDYPLPEDDAAFQYDAPALEVADTTGEKLIYKNYGPHENIWPARNGNSRDRLADIISQRLGYTLKAVKRHLGQVGLTNIVARRLKSHDPAIVELTISMLFPGAHRPVWMGDMTLEMCETLVARLHGASADVAVDEIRYRLRQSTIGAEEAKAYLTSDDDQIVHLVQRLGLPLKRGNEVQQEQQQATVSSAFNMPPWMSGMSWERQTYIVEYVMNTFGCNYDQAHDFLHSLLVDATMVELLTNLVDKKKVNAKLYKLVRSRQI